MIENIVPISTSTFHPPPPPPSPPLPSHPSSVSIPLTQTLPPLPISAQSQAPSPAIILSQKVDRISAFSNQENNDDSHTNTPKEFNGAISEGIPVGLDRDPKSLENENIEKFSAETEKIAKPGFLDAIKGMNMSKLR